jgi:hypothetical protein
MMHDKDMAEAKDEDMKEAMHDKDMSEAKEEDMKEGYGKKPMSEEDKMDEAKEEVEEEVNLEELLSEMDAEMKEEEEMKEEKKEVMEAEEEEETEDEEESIEVEDMTEDELTKFVEEVIKDMVEAGELEAGEKMDMDMDMDMEVEDEEETMEMEEGMHGDKEMEEAMHGDKEVEEGSYKYEMEETMKEKDAELKEVYETVKILKKEINEVNLLNSKLLYTNKIFRNRNLTESQKVKVLNSFDKASNVKEVKLVFESLSTTLESKKSNIKESMGFASKPTGKAPITESKEVIHEDAMVARFKKLAGL